MKQILEKQGWHAIALVILLALVFWATGWDNVLTGSLWRISTGTWLIISLAVPVIHQIYVLIIWRAELHFQWFSKKLGKLAFPLYSAGFILLFAGRFISIFFLSLANRDTLGMAFWLGLLLSALFLIFFIWTGYSVLKYFGAARAFGIDHFDPEFRYKPLVKKGIYRYFNNAMYLFGIGFIWITALALDSKTAMISAAFQYIYIWVHYYTLELPDMKKIYGIKKESG